MILGEFKSFTLWVKISLCFLIVQYVAAVILWELLISFPLANADAAQGMHMDISHYLVKTWAKSKDVLRADQTHHTHTSRHPTPVQFYFWWILLSVGGLVEGTGTPISTPGCWYQHLLGRYGVFKTVFGRPFIFVNYITKAHEIVAGELRRQ